MSAALGSMQAFQVSAALGFQVSLLPSTRSLARTLPLPPGTVISTKYRLPRPQALLPPPPLFLDRPSCERMFAATLSSLHPPTGCLLRLQRKQLVPRPLPWFLTTPLVLPPFPFLFIAQAAFHSTTNYKILLTPP